MKQAGAIVLFRFPHANLEMGKPRPALLLGKLHGKYSDWLVCMISSQVRHYLDDVDEFVRETDADFIQSGLHGESVIRVERLAVVAEEVLLGEIGSISQERLKRIKLRLAEWMKQ
jgi:mRNA interferase MazF